MFFFCFFFFGGGGGGRNHEMEVEKNASDHRAVKNGDCKHEEATTELESEREASAPPYAEISWLIEHLYGDSWRTSRDTYQICQRGGNRRRIPGTNYIRASRGDRKHGFLLLLLLMGIVKEPCFERNSANSFAKPAMQQWRNEHAEEANGIKFSSD